MIREFFAPNIERIKGICAVGAVFEEVFLRLGKFLTTFVLSETVAAAAHAGCLNCEDKVVVILSVEERHKALLAGKTLVNEKVFLIVPHGIAEIDRLDSPAVAFKLVDYHPTEVLFVDGIELERLLHALDIPLSVDRALDIAKTISTLTVSLPDSTTATRLMLMSDEQRLLQPLLPSDL